MQDSEYEKAAALATSSDTSADTLRRIAGTYPDLRALVALHPNTPPDLMARLAQESNPAIQAAVRSRLQPGVTARDQSVPERAQGMAAGPPPPPQKNKRSGSSGLLLIPVVIVLIAGLSVGAWFLLKPRNPSLFPAELTETASVPGTLWGMSADGRTAVVERPDAIVGIDTSTGREIWQQPHEDYVLCGIHEAAVGCPSWDSYIEINTGAPVFGKHTPDEQYSGEDITVVFSRDDDDVATYRAHRDGKMLWQAPDGWDNYQAHADGTHVLFYGVNADYGLPLATSLVEAETGKVLVTVPMKGTESESAFLASDGFVVFQPTGQESWEAVAYRIDGEEVWRLPGFTSRFRGWSSFDKQGVMPDLAMLQTELTKYQDQLNVSDGAMSWDWYVLYADRYGVVFGTGFGGPVGAGLNGDALVTDWTGGSGFYVARATDQSMCDTEDPLAWDCPDEAYEAYIVRDIVTGEQVQELTLPHRGALWLEGSVIAHDVEDRVTFWSLTPA